jgi:hypothetical protein
MGKTREPDRVNPIGWMVQPNFIDAGHRSGGGGAFMSPAVAQNTSCSDAEGIETVSDSPFVKKRHKPRTKMA